MGASIRGVEELIEWEFADFELIFVWDLRIGEDFSVVAWECEASIEGQTSHVRGVSSPRCSSH